MKVEATFHGDRKVIHVAEHVVIAYRDSAAYEQGRGRWRAYQEQVLRARLDRLTGARPPIEVDDHPRQSFLSEVFDMFDPFSAVPTVPLAPVSRIIGAGLYPRPATCPHGRRQGG